MSYLYWRHRDYEKIGRDILVPFHVTKVWKEIKKSRKLLFSIYRQIFYEKKQNIIYSNIPSTRRHVSHSSEIMVTISSKMSSSSGSDQSNNESNVYQPESMMSDGSEVFVQQYR